MEDNRILVKIGDPNNAYVEEDGKCITFKIDSDFTGVDYDQSKYNFDDDTMSVTNYTDTTVIADQN